MYKKINVNDVTFLVGIVGRENAITPDDQSIEIYAKDYTENLYYTPDLVLKPATTQEVMAIMHYCHEQRIIVTPRGGGTGLSGGALTYKGGVSLSCERMNRIIEIDEANLQVTVEPGVITEVLQNAVKEKGLFYPPDPSSRGSCFIGGNIAENSGGPKAVKYGVVKDYVLNLEVVLPNGSCIWTGANVLKNSTGYNVTQLMVGSEGTLGVVTKIVLKLIPYPKHEVIILAPFKSLQKAAEAVSLIFRKGFSPSVLELMERDALLLASTFIDNQTITIEEDTEAHLIIEVDGNNLDMLMQDIADIAELLSTEFGVENILFAEDSKQRAELWRLRRIVAEAAKSSGFVIEEDIVVPRASLPIIIKKAKDIARKYEFKCVCYGHAGDGNLHVRIKKDGAKNTKDDPVLQQALKELFTEVKRLSGTISGEHGIGMLQKIFMPIVFSSIEISLFKNIKKAFDPHNILNPGKIIDLD